MSSSMGNSENRAMSSVFIGNVPYDVTEEQLKDLFSEVGAVINFKLFFDKNSGKSLGFAFCEYKEPEIAVSATRNLGGYELKGQPLRVDVATSEKCRQELERLQGTIAESVSELSDSTPEKAPEEISKAVASLPAEQMFELMKQMKMCIENNPQEARNLLLQNPQLAYALLQAQVIMRIVDPEVALKILNRTGITVPTGNLNPESKPMSEQIPMTSSMGEGLPSFQPGMPPVKTEPMVSNSTVPVPQPVPNPHVRLPLDRPNLMPAPVGPVMTNQFVDQDLRTLGDQDLRLLPALGDRDLRAPPVMTADKDLRQPMGDQDFRSLSATSTIPDNRPFDPRFRNMPGTGADTNRNPGPNFERTRTGNLDPRIAYDPRTPTPVRVEDPRKASMSAAALNSRLSAAGPALQNLGPAMSNIGAPHLALGTPPGLTPMAPEDQEKAALIMQVLQLTDQQIAMLPPEQRQSIMVLKDQLARSQLA